VRLIGDSLMYQVGPRLPKVYEFDGADVTVRAFGYFGMGLLHGVGEYPTVRAYTEARLAEFPGVDTVVFEFSGVCECIGLVYGSPEYYRRWYASAKELVDAMRARGLTVLWTVTPRVNPNRLYYDVLLGISVRDRIFAAENGLVAVDWWQAFTDVTDSYYEYLWYSELLEPARPHHVRFPGSLHFWDPDGITRGSRWLAAATYQAWNGS
jgi:hypothetical protein